MKDFLKPTWGKLTVLFFLFPVLFFFQTMLSLNASSSNESNLGTMSLYLAVIAQPFIFMEHFLPRVADLLRAVFVLSLGILDFIYWYLLSCIFVGIYTTLRRQLASAERV